MLVLALLVLNHVSVIDVARGVVEPDRAVEVEGTHIRAVLPAKGFFQCPSRFRILVAGRRFHAAGPAQSNLISAVI